jgi:hypothetical protein
MRDVLTRVRALPVALAALAALAGFAAPRAAPRETAVPQGTVLPIFELVPPDTTAAGLAAVAGALGMRDAMPERRGERLVLEQGPLVAELFLPSGGVWIADREQLWNPALRPALPDADSALSFANAMVGATGLLPEEDSVRWTAIPGQTVMVRFERRPSPRRVERVILDRQVTYQATVRAGGMELPVVGGGGRLTLVLGDGGNPIAFSGTWRRLSRVVELAPILPRAEADSQFRALTRGLRVEVTGVSLAYFLAPPAVSQSHLYPVWVYTADQQVDGRRVPMRSIVIPATRYGPAALPPEAGAPPLAQLCPGSGNPRRAESGAGTKSSPFEAGAAWIRLGVPHADDNAGGFLRTLQATGRWVVNFRRGGPEACLRHWTDRNDEWVDGADFVFYTGHADPEGWQLNPGNQFLDHADVGVPGNNPPDRWGRSDLEWLIIAACGPLQDVETGEVGEDVFARWQAAFDGLHMLMGYGSRSFDTALEGRSVAGYALDGEPLRMAWLRTARETQTAMAGGRRVWAGLMYPYQNAVSAAGDHLWGNGLVSPDLRDPAGFVAIWTSI